MVVDVQRTGSKRQRLLGPTWVRPYDHAHSRGRQSRRPSPRTNRRALRHPRQRSQPDRSHSQESPLHDGSPGKVGALQSHRAGRLRRAHLCRVRRQVGDARSFRDALLATSFTLSALLRHVPRGAVQRPADFQHVADRRHGRRPLRGGL